MATISELIDVLMEFPFDLEVMGSLAVTNGQEQTIILSSAKSIVMESYRPVEVMYRDRKGVNEGA